MHFKDFVLFASTRSGENWKFIRFKAQQQQHKHQHRKDCVVFASLRVEPDYRITQKRLKVWTDSCRKLKKFVSRMVELRDAFGEKLLEKEAV